MKQTVRLVGGINELFGTLDENLKLFEASLRVSTQLRDGDLEIEGEPEQVDRAARILGEYNQRIRDGRIPSSEEVKSLLRVATAEPAHSLAGAFSPSRTRAFGKKSLAPKSTNQRRYIEALEALRHGFRHRSRRHGQNLSRRGHGRVGAALEAGQSHHPGAPGGRSRRAPGISSRHASGKSRSLHAPAL